MVRCFMEEGSRLHSPAGARLSSGLAACDSTREAAGDADGSPVAPSLGLRCASSNAQHPLKTVANPDFRTSSEPSDEDVAAQELARTNPQGWNGYAYVLGNPATLADLLGLGAPPSSGFQSCLNGCKWEAVAEGAICAGGCGFFPELCPEIADLCYEHIALDLARCGLECKDKYGQ